MSGVMQMDFSTALTVMIVMAMLIMGVSISLNSAFDKKRKIYSWLLAACIVVCSICEWAGIKLQGFDTNTIKLHIAVKGIELSLAPFVGIIPAYVIRKRNKNNVIDWLIFSVLAANIILEIASAFSGFIYNVDESNYYHHSTFYFIYYIAYGFGMAYFIYTIVRFSMHKRASFLVPNLLTAIFIVVSLGIYIIWEGIEMIDWLAICIASIFLLKFYGDVLSNTDGLTDVLNRMAFENAIKNVSYETTVIYFDVNEFKQVNDKYGHRFGDECLIKVARNLKKAYGKYGKIYRYGGDEFCVILKKRKVDVNLLNEKFNKLNSECLLEDARFPGVSLGSAAYNPETDEIRDVLEKADQEMYKNKEIAHQRTIKQQEI